MNWQILVPYPHPEDSLATVGELANTLEADEIAQSRGSSCSLD